MSERPTMIPREHWKQLGEISHIERGQSPPLNYVIEDLDSGLPFVQGNTEFGGRYPQPRFSCVAPTKVGKSGSVLVAVCPWAGKINIADQDYCIGGGVAAVLPRGYPATFVAAAIGNRSRELARVSQGTIFDAISKGELHDLYVYSPELSAAEKISEVLDTMDAAIRVTETVVAKLQAIKQGLLNDLLTRGIDVNGDLRPSQFEAPHRYKKTPLGWLPKEWNAIQICELGNVTTGKTPPAEDPSAWGEDIPFVTPGDISHGGAVVQSERHLSKRGPKYVPTAPAGATVVVCIGSTIGKVGFIQRESAFNQQINAVAPTSEHENAFIFSSICRSAYRLHRLAGLQAVPIVNKGEFQKIQVPICARDEQSEIVSRLSQIEERERIEVVELRKLISIKSGLMDDLLTGRVPVTPLL